MNENSQQENGVPYVTIETMTKELVDRLKANNTANRPIKPTVVEYLKREMVAGRFQLTNQGISVSRNGLVLDGGHRLEACAKAGYPPVRMLVLWNADPASQFCVDTHAKRSMADMMTLWFDRDVNSRRVAILTVCWRARQKWWTGLGKPSPHDMKELIGIFTDQLDWSKEFIWLAKLPASFSAAIFEVWAPERGVVLDAFMTSVLNGEILAAGDPAYALREYLIASKKKKSGGVAQSREHYEKAMFAVLAHIRGEPVPKLKRAETFAESDLRPALGIPKNEQLQPMAA